MNHDSTYIIPSLAESHLCINDSDSCINELKCGIYTDEREQGHNFFSTDLFANVVSAIALLITLIIFIYQTRQARKEQRRTIKENWYLSFILQPNMEELNNYYKDEAEQLETQIRNLKKNKSGIEIKDKAKSIKILRDIKNDFFNHFI